MPCTAAQRPLTSFEAPACARLQGKSKKTKLI